MDKYDRLTSLQAIGTNVRSTAVSGRAAGNPVRRRTRCSARHHRRRQEQLCAPLRICVGRVWQWPDERARSCRNLLRLDQGGCDLAGRRTWAGNFQIFDGRAENPFGSLGQVASPVSPAGDGFGCVNIPGFPGVQCSRFPIPFSGLFVDSNLEDAVHSELEPCLDVN